MPSCRSGGDVSVHVPHGLLGQQGRRLLGADHVRSVVLVRACDHLRGAQYADRDADLDRPGEANGR
jgi:hypothetical protein